MKPLHKIDLIFSVSGRILHAENVSGWSVQRMAKWIQNIKEISPELDHKFKVREVI